MNFILQNPSLFVGIVLTFLVGLIFEVIRCWLRISKLDQQVETQAIRDRNVNEDYNRVKGELEATKRWLDWEQDSNNGWKNEALFWRLHFNKEAALETEQLDI